MAEQVIHVFGASGAGTTTLGRFLAEQTSFYYMDTDDYLWEPTDPPFTTKREPGERVALLRREIAEHGAVVLAGSLTGWGDPLIPLFTLAIRVTTPAQIRLERLKKRERERFGSRIDVGGDMYENHRSFLEWASSYDDGGMDIRSRAHHDEWQKSLLCPVLSVDGSLPVEANYEIIRKML